MKMMILFMTIIATMSIFSQENVSNASDLQLDLKVRHQIDLESLKSGKRIACEYNCPEASFANCVRVFSEQDGKIKFQTHRRNFEEFTQESKLSDIIVEKPIAEEHLNGELTGNELDAYFLGSNQFVTQVDIEEFSGADIAIHWVQTTKGVEALSADIPYGANLLPNKLWCETL